MGFRFWRSRNRSVARLRSLPHRAYLAMSYVAIGVAEHSDGLLIVEAFVKTQTPDERDLLVGQLQFCQGAPFLATDHSAHYG